MEYKLQLLHLIPIWINISLIHAEFMYYFMLYKYKLITISNYKLLLLCTFIMSYYLYINIYIYL